MNASSIEQVKPEPVMNTMTLQLPISIGSTPAKQLSMFLRNFLWTICETHLQHTSRRDEAFLMAVTIVTSTQQSNQITNVEADSIIHELTQIEVQVYPGSSKI